MDVYHLLIDNSIDINIKDKYGNTALWTAVFNFKGRNYELVEELVKLGPDINSKNDAGRSPLDFAEQVNNKKLISILKSSSL